MARRMTGRGDRGDAGGDLLAPFELRDELARDRAEYAPHIVVPVAQARAFGRRVHVGVVKPVIELDQRHPDLGIWKRLRPFGRDQSADMITVEMRKDHRLDVLRIVARRGEIRRRLPGAAGERIRPVAGVDNEQIACRSSPRAY